jgi:general secretion pathway protein D
MRIVFALLATLTLAASALAASTDKIDFNFNNADITQVLQTYAKASGQKFIIDPAVHGKITIINPGPVTVEEAFNQMSSALAVNSLAISKQDDVMVVKNARSIQRDLIDMGHQLPPLRPEKMYTLIIDLKNTSADEVNKQLRILTSKDGELVPFPDANEIVVTDWVSNLYRIQKLLSDLDEHSKKRAKK